MERKQSANKTHQASARDSAVEFPHIPISIPMIYTRQIWSWKFSNTRVVDTRTTHRQHSDSAAEYLHTPI